MLFMKIFIKSLPITLFLFFSSQTRSQQNVSINSTGATAHPSAMLDISSTSKGLLIPRMTSTQLNGIGSPATGLLVYQTDTDSGFYYYTGSRWIQMAAADTSTKSAWLLGGNKNTNPATHFIGTADNKPLKFRVNNQAAGEIGNSNFTIAGIGQKATDQNLVAQ